MAFLRDLGARDRFSSYYSPVLDGKQWQLFDGCRSHEGSNAYPKGSEKLLKYLADEFGCEEMRPQHRRPSPRGEEARQRLENGTFAHWTKRLRELL